MLYQSTLEDARIILTFHLVKNSFPRLEHIVFCLVTASHLASLDAQGFCSGQWNISVF